THAPGAVDERHLAEELARPQFVARDPLTAEGDGDLHLAFVDDIGAIAEIAVAKDLGTRGEVFPQIAMCHGQGSCRSPVPESGAWQRLVQDSPCSQPAMARAMPRAQRIVLGFLAQNAQKCQNRCTGGWGTKVHTMLLSWRHSNPTT